MSLPNDPLADLEELSNWQLAALWQLWLASLGSTNPEGWIRLARSHANVTLPTRRTDANDSPAGLSHQINALAQTKDRVVFCYLLGGLQRAGMHRAGMQRPRFPCAGNQPV